jgi:hypothetical protein
VILEVKTRIGPEPVASNIFVVPSPDAQNQRLLRSQDWKSNMAFDFQKALVAKIVGSTRYDRFR